MKIRAFIPKSKCDHIKEMSYYNGNYYKLPIQLMGCGILFERYWGDESFDNCSIGNIFDGVFTRLYYLNEEDRDDFFIIDSESVSEINKRT